MDTPAAEVHTFAETAASAAPAATAETAAVWVPRPVPVASAGWRCRQPARTAPTAPPAIFESGTGIAVQGTDGANGANGGAGANGTGR